MTTPIWLIKTKGALQVAGTWIKGHWFLLLLFAGIIYAFLFAKNKNGMIEQLMKELREQQAVNRQQLDDLRKIQQEHITQQHEINQKYNEVLDRIQKDYREQLNTLDAQKEVDLRHIIATNKDDPAAMARDINILFGIPIYPTSPS